MRKAEPGRCYKALLALVLTVPSSAMADLTYYYSVLIENPGTEVLGCNKVNGGHQAAVDDLNTRLKPLGYTCHSTRIFGLNDSNMILCRHGNGNMVSAYWFTSKSSCEMNQRKEFLKMELLKK